MKWKENKKAKKNYFRDLARALADGAQRQVIHAQIEPMRLGLKRIEEQYRLAQPDSNGRRCVVGSCVANLKWYAINGHKSQSQRNLEECMDKPGETPDRYLDLRTELQKSGECEE
jgi:hypothetical protein